MEQVLIKIISARDGEKIAQAIQYHFSAQDHVRIQDRHTPLTEYIDIVVFIMTHNLFFRSRSALVT